MRDIDDEVRGDKTQSANWQKFYRAEGFRYRISGGCEKSFNSWQSHMNQLQAMRVFTRVVELGSFAMAARQLGMSSASVTRSVGMLEAHLNSRLLHRDTRSLSLTENGKDYLNGCRSVIEQLEELETFLLQATREVRGTLRIAAPMRFVVSGLAELLAGYQVVHPRVDFNVTTFDARIDIIAGGFDVCFSDNLRVATSTYVSRRLTVVEDIVVASPTYLCRRGTPADPPSLDRHCLLAMTDGTTRAWEFTVASSVYRVPLGSGVTATSSLLVREAALNHMGIALLPASLVAQDIRSGALVRLLQQFEVNGGPRHLSLLYPGPYNLSRKVRTFIDYTVAHYRTPGNAVSLRAIE
jgi:DNA-binding transcriptional LysR family regulator